MSHRKALPFQITHHVRDACLCLHIERAARAVARRFDEALRPLDLTSGQFSLMISLNRPHPLGITAVSLVLGMDRTTVTASLKPLARRGLVKILVDKADKRSRMVQLTPAGRALLAAAYPIWQRTHESLEAVLGKSATQRMRADLRTLSTPDDAP